MKTSTYQTVVTLAIGFTALYVARDVLLPLAVAALLAFVLLPIVRRLERYRVRRVPAVLLTVLAVASFGAFACYQTAEQVIELAGQLPEYRQNIREKLGSARQFLNPLRERVRVATNIVSDIGKEPNAQARKSSDEASKPADQLTQPAEKNTSSGPLAPQRTNVRGGESAGPESNAIELVHDWLLPVISPLATGAVVVLFTIFMLIEWEDLRNRFIVLCGVHRVPGTTEALEESAARVSRYLRVQLLINGMYGVGLATICFLVGLPNPLLWGTVGALFRFVPYAGALVGATLPILLAVAVTDGWGVVFVTAAAVISLELVTGNVLEPWLYGTSTGVSPSGIVISAFFWTWLWGGVGLLLATPLTVVLTIVGRQVPPLRFITTLFSDEPPLPAAARLYQRLLARDTDEVVHILEQEFPGPKEPEAIADLLLQPLTQAVTDETHGVLTDERLAALMATLEDVGLEVSDIMGAETSQASKSASISLVVAPARTAADAAASQLVAMALSHAGWPAEKLRRAGLASDLAKQIAESHADALIVCGVGPRSMHHFRYLRRHLESAGWDHPIFLLLVSSMQPPPEEVAALTSGLGVTLVRSATELMQRLVGLQRARPSTPAVAADPQVATR